MAAAASRSMGALFRGSSAGEAYHKFRPVYPASLYTRVMEYVRAAPAVAEAPSLYVDLGAGTGQATHALAAHFPRVLALDSSADQIATARNACPRESAHVEFAVGDAEHVPQVADGAASLITVAQALHWLRHDEFFAECKRMLRTDGGVLACWGFSLLRFEHHPRVNALLDAYHTETMGPYWHPRRKFLDDGYATIPFPFAHVVREEVAMRVRLPLRAVEGYLHTFSCLRTYMEQHGGDDAPWRELCAAVRAEVGHGDGEVGEDGDVHVDVNFPVHLILARHSGE